MLEYLNRSLRSITAALASAAIANSPSRSGKSRQPCQKSPSSLSRITPPPWLSSSPTVTAATGLPASSGTRSPSVSSSRSRPCSSSCRTATAAKLLECEAIRNRCCSVNASPVSRFALPKAADSTGTPRSAIATCTPGTRRNQRR